VFVKRNFSCEGSVSCFRFLFGAREDLLGFKVIDGGCAVLNSTTFEVDMQKHLQDPPPPLLQQQQQQQNIQNLAPPGQCAGRIAGNNSELTLSQCRVVGLTHGINIKDNCRCRGWDCVKCAGGGCGYGCSCGAGVDCED
jgi:hypothetical protein